MSGTRPPNEPAARERLLPGRLQRFLAAHAGEDVVIGNFRRCSSGFSWSTFSLTATTSAGGSRELILQVGPPTGLLAPYSARPQAAILQALASTAVPVAPLVAWSDDERHLGAPFFVCQKMPGEPVVPWGLERVPQGERRQMAESFVDILGTLHAPDAPVHALQALHPGVTAESATRIEVEAWMERMERWRCRSYPLLTWAGRWLLDNARAAPRVCIAHGDFRLGNFLQQRGHITAVLDWEMVHLGHPHEDLGWLLLAMYNKGSQRLFGELPRLEVLDRYTALSGIGVEPDSLHYFECLAMFKSVALTLAALDSYVRRGFDDMRMAAMATSVASLARQLDKLIQGEPR